MMKVRIVYKFVKILLGKELVRRVIYADEG